MSPLLRDFLDNHLPKTKSEFLLGVTEEKLASIITKQLEINCDFHSQTICELFKGIKANFSHFSKDLLNNRNTADNYLIQSLTICQNIEYEITLRVNRLKYV